MITTTLQSGHTGEVDGLMKRSGVRPIKMRSKTSLNFIPFLNFQDLKIFANQIEA